MISGNANNNCLHKLYLVRKSVTSIELLLNLIQKEYIEQFIFEKGSGGGGSVGSAAAAESATQNFQLISVLGRDMAKATIAG